MSFLERLTRKRAQPDASSDAAPPAPSRLENRSRRTFMKGTLAVFLGSSVATLTETAAYDAAHATGATSAPETEPGEDPRAEYLRSRGFDSVQSDGQEYAVDDPAFLALLDLYQQYPPAEPVPSLALNEVGLPAYMTDPLTYANHVVDPELIQTGTIPSQLPLFFLDISGFTFSWDLYPVPVGSDIVYHRRFIRDADVQLQTVDRAEASPLEAYPTQEELAAQGIFLSEGTDWQAVRASWEGFTDRDALALDRETGLPQFLANPYGFLGGVFELPLGVILPDFSFQLSDAVTVRVSFSRVKASEHLGLQQDRFQFQYQLSGDASWYTIQEVLERWSAAGSSEAVAALVRDEHAYAGVQCIDPRLPYLYTGRESDVQKFLEFWKTNPNMGQTTLPDYCSSRAAESVPVQTDSSQEAQVFDKFVIYQGKGDRPYLLNTNLQEGRARSGATVIQGFPDADSLRRYVTLHDLEAENAVAAAAFNPFTGEGIPHAGEDEELEAAASTASESVLVSDWEQLRSDRAELLERVREKITTAATARASSADVLPEQPAWLGSKTSEAVRVIKNYLQRQTPPRELQSSDVSDVIVQISDTNLSKEVVELLRAAGLQLEVADNLLTGQPSFSEGVAGVVAHGDMVLLQFVDEVLDAGLELSRMKVRHLGIYTEEGATTTEAYRQSFAEAADSGVGLVNFSSGLLSEVFDPVNGVPEFYIDLYRFQEQMRRLEDTDLLSVVAVGNRGQREHALWPARLSQQEQLAQVIAVGGVDASGELQQYTMSGADIVEQTTFANGTSGATPRVTAAALSLFSYLREYGVGLSEVVSALYETADRPDAQDSNKPIGAWGRGETDVAGALSTALGIPRDELYKILLPIVSG